MKLFFVSFLVFLGISFASYSQNFTQLEAIDAVSGSKKNLASLAKEKGLVFIFYDPSCPFAKLYETRIIGLVTKFQAQGIGFALVHPQTQPSESEQIRLQTYIEESGLKMPYLIDGEQAWIKLFQINKIPEVILLVPGQTGLEVVYKGAIDTNPQVESAVTEKYLEEALAQVIGGEKPTTAQARAVGCNIRIF